MYPVWRPGARPGAALIRGQRLLERLKIHEQPDAENTLADQVPIELLRLLTFFLQANANNLLNGTITGKRNREVGLVRTGEVYSLHARTR